MDIAIKRIYEAPADSDGYRVLVDRVWPRGISKEKAALAAWHKDIAPSQELRKWFGHVPEKFPAFQEKYIEELDHNPALADFLKEIQKAAEAGRVTLLFGAKDEIHNQVAVLKAYLDGKLAK